MLYVHCFITDDCCYLYGSVPRSDINCVPEGGQLALSFIIYNPHDNFSNFTVTWFRSTTGDMSAYEAVPIDSNNNVFISRSPVTRALPNQNCSSVLYRDIFTLAISHFTRDRNGYYWCQISINNTYYAQRSRYAWFYAGEFDSTTCSSLTPFFRSAFLNETECIQYDPSTATLVASSTTTLMPTSSGNKSDYLLIYVLGGFSALLLVVLVGVVILSLSLALYVYHLKKKLSKLCTAL